MRRNGFVIMLALTKQLGSLVFVMLLAIINGALGFIAAIGVPLFGALGVAKLLGAAIPLSYGWIAALAIICGVVRGLLRYVEQYGNHFIAFKILAVLRDKMFKALRKLCPAKLETKQKGNIIAMMTSDIETLEVFYAHTLSPIGIAILVSTGVFVFVGLFANWWLALVALVGYIIIAIAMPALGGKALKDGGVAYRKQLASFNSYFLDSIKGVKEITLHGASASRSEEVAKRSDSINKESYKLNNKTFLFANLTQVVVSLIITAALAVAVFALPITGDLHIGIVIVALTAIFSSFGPVIALANLPGSLTQTFAAGDRMLDLLSEKPEVEDITNGENIDFEKLEVKNLRFGYDENEVLNGVSLEAQKGHIIGIVGASGTGKSTLLKLLMRFWQKKSGEILYNGIDIDKINTESLLNNVAMVSQTTYLFDDTLEENLRIAYPKATLEEIEDACKKASVHDFIASLPQGYQTRAGTLGDRLSAGEKQRIGLARAFLRGSTLILLDEPTSNIDSINEGIILNALLKHKKDKAILLVSHRESTMSIADKVYKFENQ